MPARELDEVDRVAGDGDDGCALRTDGIWCWASHGKGHPPTRMKERRDINDLEVDGFEGCAVTKGGEVLCWSAGIQKADWVFFKTGAKKSR